MENYKDAQEFLSSMLMSVETIVIENWENARKQDSLQNQKQCDDFWASQEDYYREAFNKDVIEILIKKSIQGVCNAIWTSLKEEAHMQLFGEERTEDV